MNTSFVVAVWFSTTGMQGFMSPESKYQYVFVRCEVAASVP